MIQAESPGISLTPQSPAAAERLLTVQEVAELLRLPVSWVYERTRWQGNQQLPHMKMGKYLRFRKAEVLGWLDACRI